MSRTRPERVAGLLLAAAGSAILMGIITAEALYPADYTTNANEISDLGATRPPGSVILQPSATIFNVTMIVTGLAVIAAAVLLSAREGPALPVGHRAPQRHRHPGRRRLPRQRRCDPPLVRLAGLHRRRVLRDCRWRARTGPVSWFSFVLGTITLGTLVYALFGGLDAPLLDDLGDGGTERWIAYPVVLWQVMFGGALMAGSLSATAASETHAAGESPARH